MEQKFYLFEYRFNDEELQLITDAIVADLKAKI